MYSRAARVVAFARPASNSIINTVPRRPFTISQIRHQMTEQHNQPATATDAIDRVSDRIKHDHRELEQYYNNIKSANRDDDKVKWQNMFVWELARHSIAEEIVVYPAFEKHVSNGQKMAEKDRAEHQQVKEKLYEFQQMSPSDANFDPAIDSLWETLSQHITEEERDDLPELEKAIDSDMSGSLARSFHRTKHFVPTRSHPSAPDRPPFETAAGLLTTPLDKLMDMFRKFPDDSEKGSSK